MNADARLKTCLAPVSAAHGQPLHRQVEARIRELITQAGFRNGRMLPDELTLAMRLGVSRGTARAALIRLVHEGVLERKAGVGTRVARSRGESGIRAWRSFSREMAAKGIQVENFSSEFRVYRVTEKAARAMQLEPGVSVPRLDRVRGWDGLPVVYSRSWFHPRLRLSGEEDFAKPLYDLIEAETGAIADSAREEFTAVAATAGVAKRLGVAAGAPVLLRCHAVADASGRPIEYAEVHYVSSRFTLTLDLRREQL